MTTRSIFLLATLGAAAAHSLGRRDELDSGNADRWPPCTSSYFSSIFSSHSRSLSDNATGGKAWQTAFTKASKLVAQMTLAEKTNLTSGVIGPCAGTLGSVDRLGIPGFCLQDGPAGIRPVHGASQFPAGLTTAATWDRDLIYARAAAMGQEFYDQGALCRTYFLSLLLTGHLDRCSYCLVSSDRWSFGSFPTVSSIWFPDTLFGKSCTH